MTTAACVFSSEARFGKAATIMARRLPSSLLSALLAVSCALWWSSCATSKGQLAHGRIPTRSYDKHGFVFRYPEELKVVEEVDAGYRGVDIDIAEGSSITANVVLAPEDMTTDMYSRGLMGKVCDALVKKGGTRIGDIEPVSRSVGGRTEHGYACRVRFSGFSTSSEFISYRVGGQLVGLLMIAADDEKADAERVFGVVLGSFEYRIEQ